MNILITGGAGFLGSHLCDRLLADGHSVVCVDNLISGSEANIAHLSSNKNFTFINHDVIQPLPANISADALFHLASPASPNHHSAISYHSLPLPTMLVNTTGTLELLRFAKKNNATFLFASTSEAYGDPLEHPQQEDYRGNVSTTGPRSVYDEAKRFGETITAYFWRSEGVDARIARIFNTYGPRLQKTDMRMIVRFITQALEDKPITVFGDGTQTRSLAYVSDTIDGLVKLMFSDNTSQTVVNVGSPDEHTVLEYAQIVKELTHSKSEVTFSEELPADDPLKRRPDITLARSLLQWEPKITLEEGLVKMIEYVKSST
ncbi:SDR family oxidoreductase [Candidatus Microgenomates bacterium]|nr:SDR family oxidoreductase [Candidatus Microgenomates bacterium]